MWTRPVGHASLQLHQPAAPPPASTSAPGGTVVLRHLFSADELATARPVAGGEADWGERSKRRTAGIAARWRLVKLGLPDRAHSTRLLIVSDQWDGVQQKQTQTSVASARLGRWLSFTCVVAICPAGSVCC